VCAGSKALAMVVVHSGCRRARSPLIGRRPTGATSQVGQTRERRQRTQCAGVMARRTATAVVVTADNSSPWAGWPVESVSVSVSEL